METMTEIVMAAAEIVTTASKLEECLRARKFGNHRRKTVKQEIQDAIDRVVELGSRPLSLQTQ